MKSPDRSIGLKERIGLTVATIGVGLAMNFGIDIRGGVVNAANITPTRTPTVTSTPNVLATQQAARETVVAGLEQDVGSLQEQIDLQKKEADLRKKAECLRGVLNGTGTPCPTATPSATPTWTAEQIEIKTRAGLITPTPTPGPRLPEIIPTLERTGEGKGNNREIPWELIIGGGILGLVGGAVVFRRRIMDLVRRIPHP